MSGGSKTQTTTSVQDNQPWTAAQPALKTGLSDAQSLYKSGVGSQPYTGSTVVPYSQQSMQGFGDIQNKAQGAMGAGNPFQKAFDATGDLADSGFNTLQSGAINSLQNQAGGSVGSGFDPSQTDALSKYRDTANAPTGTGFDQAQDDALARFRTTAATPVGSGFDQAQQNALTNYQNTASGNDLFGTNPHFEAALGRAQDDVRDGVNETASAMGRFGSGAHQGVLGDSIGDLSARMRGDEYSRQLARKDQATNNLFSAGQAGYDNRYRDNARGDQAANSLFTAGQAGMDNRFRDQSRSDQATNNMFSAGQTGVENRLREQGRLDQLRSELFNAGQTGVGNQFDAINTLPGAFQNQMAPADALIGVGSQYEDLAGRTLNDQLRIFDETQNAPWNQIGRLNAVAGGAGQFGTSTNTAQVPGQNNSWANAAGGLLGANSLLGGLF